MNIKKELIRLLLSIGLTASIPAAASLTVGNTVFGTVNTDSGNPGGYIYSLQKDGTGYTILHSFVDEGNGMVPGPSLSLGQDGAIYGTTTQGGTNQSCGVAFKINQDGTGYQVVFNFGPKTKQVPVEGSIVCWGGTENGAAAAPSGLTNVTSISAGLHHSLGLLDNGTVVGWGRNDSQQASPPQNLNNAIATAVGDFHSLVLTANESVVAWGSASNGVLEVPSGLHDVVAVAAGSQVSLALRSNGTTVQWGSFPYPVPAGLNDVVAIAASGSHCLALRKNATVVAWGDPSQPEVSIPVGLNNVVAIAAGPHHNLALIADGTVVASGDNSAGQCNVPTALNNVIAIAAGAQHSVALKNDGTVITWGSGSGSLAPMPCSLTNGLVKLVSAGGDSTVAAVYSPVAQYPVDVTRDLLLVYNTNSADSIYVKDYYSSIARWLLEQLCSASAGYSNSMAPGYYEAISRADLTNMILAPIQAWLAANPTKRPSYVVLFLDIPSRVCDDTRFPINGNYPTGGTNDSVSLRVHELSRGWRPFVTHMNMGGTADCTAYIDKVAAMYSRSAGNDVVISASANGYANTNLYIDDLRESCYQDLPYLGSAESLTLPAGSSSLQYVADNGTLSGHVTSGNNVAGYFSWGVHGGLGPDYAVNGAIRWTANSGWWVIATAESFNGLRNFGGQGTFTRWFNAGAFGGSAYENTPIGAVSHVDEPGAKGVNTPDYFKFWTTGKNFGQSAWNSRVTHFFQAVGDPLVKR